MKPIKYLKNVKTKTYLEIFGALVIMLTALRFVAMDYWWIRIFDFPHVQLTVITIIAFVVYFVKFNLKRYQDYIFAILLLGCMLYQVFKIYTYTPLAAFEIGDAKNIKKEKSISFYTANVLQKNEEPEHLQNVLDTLNADVLLFTETDKKWQKHIKAHLSSDYKYQVEIPLPNTYGMLMYSKLELLNPKVKYQVEDSIPSIHTKVKLPSGDMVQLYSIHPTPPMPQHNPKSSERDKEMMLTAKLAKDSDLPVVVMGDFNDVAWSQTTILFQRISGLLDPRKGRGLFNTFNAKNILMRWPLDHVFVGPEFRVMDVKLGEDINSDHFPVYIKLSYEPDNAKEQKLKPATEAELNQCKNQIQGTDMSLEDVY